MEGFVSYFVQCSKRKWMSSYSYMYVMYLYNGFRLQYRHAHFDDYQLIKVFASVHPSPLNSSSFFP
jgi:hypothetical protein